MGGRARGSEGVQCIKFLRLTYFGQIKWRAFICKSDSLPVADPEGVQGARSNPLHPAIFFNIQ